MNCPACSGVTGVRETRPGADDGVVERTRICENNACGRRMTTVEVVVHLDSTNPTDQPRTATIRLRDLKKILQLAVRGLASHPR